MRALLPRRRVLAALGGLLAAPAAGRAQAPAVRRIAWFGLGPLDAPSPYLETLRTERRDLGWQPWRPPPSPGETRRPQGDPVAVGIDDRPTLTRALPAPRPGDAPMMSRKRARDRRAARGGGCRRRGERPARLRRLPLAGRPG